MPMRWFALVLIALSFSAPPGPLVHARGGSFRAGTVLVAGRVSSLTGTVLVAGGVPSLTRTVLVAGGVSSLTGTVLVAGGAFRAGGVLVFERGAGGFRWPLDPPVTVARRFEPPPDPYKAGHRGADLLGAAGAQVHSAGAGVVAFAGMVAGRPVVSVSHPGGLRTTYEPVDPSVRAGTVVSAGTPLGVLRPGHPGCPAIACLHWGLRSGETYLDPLSLLRRGRVRLLPL